MESMPGLWGEQPCRKRSCITLGFSTGAMDTTGEGKCNPQNYQVFVGIYTYDGDYLNVY